MLGWLSYGEIPQESRRARGAARAPGRRQGKARPIRVDLRSLQRPLRRHGGYPGRLDLGRASNP
jgi:hypothetical protein